MRKKGLALRTAEIHGLAGRRSGATGQVGDNLSHLRGSCDAVTVSDRLSNRRDGDGPGSIIEGTIDPCDVPLLRMHPLQEHSNLIEVRAETRPPDRSTWISFGRRGAFVPSLPTPCSPSDLIQDRG